MTERSHYNFNRSKLKTVLKRKGFKVPRKFFIDHPVIKKGGRLFRLRFFSINESNFYPCVDVSEPDFCRWGNSTMVTVPMKDFFYDLGIDVKRIRLELK